MLINIVPDDCLINIGFNLFLFLILCPCKYAYAKKKNSLKILGFSFL